MEFTWKKILAICIACVVLILGPVFILFSNTVPDYCQARIDKNPTDPNSKWLQMKIAELCFKTWRYEKAEKAYYTYYERYVEDPEREYALYRWCLCREETQSSRDAIKAFEWFLEQYPEGKHSQDAKDGIVRIKYHKAAK